MYHFLQFRADKKDIWRLFDEKQLPALERPPAFMTVLKVDKDPEDFAASGEDPLEHVKYLGPMYFDFDGPDIDSVLDSVRKVLTYLTKNLDIDPDFIHCWLSGQKGVHITVPEQVFGVKTPQKYLPLIYREIAAAVAVEYLDTSVYSTGRGRMWRCENIARPGSGTYKVGVSFDELMNMTADLYASMVAQPRPVLAREVPAPSVIFPKAESLFKSAKATAMKRVREMRSSKAIPVEALRNWEGIPGCIEKLITEGDSAESNWNQAAMQVAAYIAARYDREDKDEYDADIVKPFVVNVHSSSRPSERERRKQVEYLINRAFTGRIKFLPGPLIAAIGKPCGNCLICRGDLKESTAPDESGNYDSVTRIKATENGYFQVGETGSRWLGSFVFWPHTEVFELEEAEDGSELKQTDRVEMVGTLLTCEGVVKENHRIPESAWASKREMISAVQGIKGARVFASDADLQMMLLAVERLGHAKATAENREIETVVRTQLCGVLLDRQKDNVIPHYVEDAGSCSTYGRVSKYTYCGDPKLSPKLLTDEVTYPFSFDTELELAIEHLTKINEAHSVASVLGWAVACHFREHIQFDEVQFPLLNLSGNAESGKTSMAILILHINGMDYTRADFLNVETGTIYPLIKYLSNSTTVPRLVEEVNPSIVQHNHYAKILGLFKAAWNRAPVPRGHIGQGRKVETTNDRVSSPIIFTSEQAPTVPSLRSRTVEVKLTSRALTNPEYQEHYKEANKRRYALMRMAKALVTKAVNTPPQKVLKVFEEMGQFVPDEIGPRPKWSFQTVLTGLHMLAETMDDYEVRGREHVDALIDALKEHLKSSVGEMVKEKRHSEVSRVLNAMNQMADAIEDPHYCLKPGTHYWRQGNYLYLNVLASLPRYCRYAKSIDSPAVIRDHRQMATLLEGSTYFDRKEMHPTRQGVEIYVIDIAKAGEEGAILTNFQDGTEPEG